MLKTGTQVLKTVCVKTFEILSSHPYTEEAQPLISGVHELTSDAAAQVLVDLRSEDSEEEKKVDVFLRRGCGCSLAPGGCCPQFHRTQYDQEF